MRAIQVRPTQSAAMVSKRPVKSCDDGNTITEACAYGERSCEVCSEQCTLVDGATSYCGDGAIDEDNGESCDDENTDNTDGCLNTCDVATCGDGVTRTDLAEGQEGFEACDDANTDNTDGCVEGCQLAECGDGYTWSNGGAEECDDFNDIDDDSCTNACLSAYCGDGAINNNEPCDSSDPDNTIGCDDACNPILCGNGALDEGEDCDEGGIETANCDLNCTFRVCGDSTTNLTSGELCDDGNALNNDGCLDNCDLNVCGDGFQYDGVEGCDDGNVTTEACDYGEASCTVCNSDCDIEAGATSFCGDDTVDATNNETCDDGNAITELCTYGLEKCTVCNDTCLSTAGETRFAEMVMWMRLLRPAMTRITSRTTVRMANSHARCATMCVNLVLAMPSFVVTGSRKQSSVKNATTAMIATRMVV